MSQGINQNYPNQTQQNSYQQQYGWT